MTKEQDASSLFWNELKITKNSVGKWRWNKSNNIPIKQKTLKKVN